ncbi:hypothetical protein [Bacillus alkalicellulosilyticus]|uniref:hypothetical protein n=1 Tax=Alkalihalobacterium alkalicellulosilyticum TaxID=1912214 RepID=UPI00099670AA|nr:hypothetical protein [Bacillus alkalicellulosilyticus]
MKKVIMFLFIGIFIIAFYEYQKPIMNSAEAMISAVDCLNNPPEHLGIFPDYIDIETIHNENVYTYLFQQKGYYNELMNKQRWEVKLKYDGKEPTVLLDAYSGKCISVYGPMS